MSNLELQASTDEPLLSDKEWQAIGLQLELSGRECDVLRYVVEDVKESIIARRLGISSHTVHTHMNRLYEKLGVGSRVELILLIFREYIAHTCQRCFEGCGLEAAPCDCAGAHWLSGGDLQSRGHGRIFPEPP
jgi:DNA-binding CsgD family transcriptional regulator